MKKTIAEIVDSGLCVGCGTCASICTTSAIKLHPDIHKGLYLPSIDRRKCTLCGICTDICPGGNVDFDSLNSLYFGRRPTDRFLGNYINCYLANAADEQIRYNSSSGGFITTILIFALENGIIDGALVTSMNKTNPLEPHSFIACNREQILSASHSKYCPVPANMALRDIIESSNNKRYAVVGLPCHIHGIRKTENLYRQLREKIVLHIGIFCEEGTFTFLGTKYQLMRKGIKENEIKQIDYRGKGWPGYTTIQLKNGKGFSIPYQVFAGGRFNFFIPWRCTLCSDATAELADISCGDPWLLEISRHDRIGSSVVIARNNEAEKILQEMISGRVINAHRIDSESIKRRSFLYKKEQLLLRLRIAKFLGRKIPNFYQNQQCIAAGGYLRSLFFYLGNFLSARSNRWWMLNYFYFPLLRLIKILKNIYERAIKHSLFWGLDLNGSLDRYFLFGDNPEDNLKRGKIIKQLVNSCGENVTIAPGVLVSDPKMTKIGANVHIGLCTYIGIGPITIEDHVSIGPHCSITAHNHDFADAGPIIIGAHTWLGANVSVTAGVQIGKHNVIGAGAVVTKNTDDYAVMVGVPAKKVGIINPHTLTITYFKQHKENT